MAKALEEMGYGKGVNAINRWRLKEWEVLHQICTAHGIEISEPKKSRGYSYKSQEYGEHQDKIRELEAEKAQITTERDETRAELEKAAKKKAKLTEIDCMETGKTMFGGKITVSQEDWDNVTALAKKEVASQKQTKKLKKERDDAVQRYDELKKKYDSTSAELLTYKKKEDEKRHFSREKLRKAMSFISACGLADNFARYRINKTRGSELE